MDQPNKKDCGCGERAKKIIRKLDIDENTMPDSYIENHHAAATAKALWMRLTRK